MKGFSFKVPFPSSRVYGGINPADLASTKILLEMDEKNMGIRTASEFDSTDKEFTSTTEKFKGNSAVGFTAGCWFNPDTVDTTARGIMGAYPSSSDRGWSMYTYNNGGNYELRSVVSTDGTSSTDTQLSYTTSYLTTGGWQLVMFKWDAVNEIFYLKIGNGAWQSKAADFAGALHAAAYFAIGQFNASGYQDGAIDSAFFLDGLLLSDAQCDEIHALGENCNSWEFGNLSFIDPIGGDAHFWSLNEPTGERHDSFGTEHLSVTGVVSTKVGYVIDRGQDQYVGYSRQFTASNSEMFTNTDAVFQRTDESWTYTGRFYQDTVPSSYGIVQKFQSSGGNKMFCLRGTTSAYQFRVTEDGSTNLNINSDVTPSAGVWHTFAIVYDNAAGEIKISIDKEAFRVQGGIGDLYPSTNSFVMGRFDNANYHNGRIENVGYWGKAMSQAECDLAVDRKYEDQDTTDLIAYYRLNEASGNAIDAHGTYDLTDNNTVTQAAGTILDTKETIYDISYATDVSGNGNHFIQPTPSARMSYNATTKTLHCDGIGEWMYCINDTAGGIDSDTQGEIWIVGAREDRAASHGPVFSCGDKDASNEFFFCDHGSAIAGVAPHGIRTNLNTGGSSVERLSYIAKDENDVFLIARYSSNDTTMTLQLNGVPVPVSVDLGSNNGQWIGDVAGTCDQVTIGKHARLTGVYSECAYKSVLYSDTAYDAETNAGVNAYFNNKWSVYTPITSLASMGSKLKYAWYFDQSNSKALSLTPEQAIFTGDDADGGDISGALEYSGALAVASEKKRIDSFPSASTDFNTSLSNLVRTVGHSEGGRSDVLKLELSGGATTHSVRESSFYEQRKVIKTTISFYIPSTNSLADALLIGTTGSTGNGYRFEGYATDTWHTEEITLQYAGTGQQAFIQVFNGSNASIDADGDYILIGSVLTEILDTKPFDQATASARGVADVTNKTHDCDGVAEYYSNPDLFTEISGDTQGEIITKFQDDEGSGNTIIPISLWDGSTSDEHFNLTITGGGNIIRISDRVSASANNVDFGNLAISRGGEIDVSLSSDGATYRAFSGYEDAGSTTTGTNNGDWIGDNPSLAEIELFRLGYNPTFYAGGMKQLFIFSEQLAMDERRRFKQFRDTL